MSKATESKFRSFLAAKSGATEGVQAEGDDVAIATETIRGRSSGMRNDPAFEQVTAYIRKRTHDAVKMALLKEGRRRQFSELVEELLSTWAQEIG